MNAKSKFIVFLCAMSGSAHAMDWFYVLQDPLSTRSSVPESVGRRAGDNASYSCTASSSDIQQPSPLTLVTAVDMALCHNPQVKAAWTAIKVQAQSLGEAKATYLPTLNATVSHLKNETRYTEGSVLSTSNAGRTRHANFTWRLFDFGTRSANLEAANQLLTAALASHDAALQKALTSVIGAYFEAMTAQGTMRARAQTVDLATNTWIATQRREVRGVASVSDTLQAKSALAKAQLALSRAQGDVQKTRSVLLYVMGSPKNTEWVLPDELVDTHEEVSVEDLEQWLIEAQAKHPAIAAARAQVAASKAKVRAVQAEGLPSLDYTQNYYENGYPNQGLSNTNSKVKTLGVSLNIPLFEGFSRTYKVRGAEAQSELSEIQLQETESQTLMEVVKAHADARSSFENLQASKQLLSAAQATANSLQKRYDKGGADILELLSSQTALADAQQERIRCVSDWRSARLRLMSSVGVLGREGLN